MGKHKNQRQETILLSYMEKNQDLAKGFVKGDKAYGQGLWSKLAQQLNSVGPPIKDVNGWKKVWLDWKINIRKKLAHNKKEVKSTGGGPNNIKTLSQTEDTIAKITGIYTVIDGIRGTSAFGDKSTAENTVDATEAFNPECTPSTSSSSQSLRFPPTPRSNVGRAGKHINNYMDVHEVTLKGIAKQVSESVEVGKENKSTLKRIHRSLEKMSNILKQQAEETMRHNLEIEKLKREKYEIKKKRLEIEEMRLQMQCYKN